MTTPSTRMGKKPMHSTDKWLKTDSWAKPKSGLMPRLIALRDRSGKALVLIEFDTNAAKECRECHTRQRFDGADLFLATLTSYVNTHEGV